MGDKLSRRSLLQKGLAVGAVYAFPTIVPCSVFGADAPSNKITMGFIGTGSQGFDNLRDFLHKRDCRIVAVCDVDSAHRLRARKVARLDNDSSYSDFREMLARDDIDAVAVSTPDHWHALISIAAAKAGKDVYCEKPLVYSVAEGRALCDAVKRYGRILQTGSHQRSDNKFRFACELVCNGRIGKLHTIKVEIPRNSRPNPLKWNVTAPPKGLDYDLWLGPAPYRPYVEQGCHYNWHFLRDFGSGQLTNWGAHMLDIAQWGKGTDSTGPVEVSGTGEFPKDGLFETPQVYDIKYTYADGVNMLCQTTQTDETGDLGASVRFEGSDGWVFVSRYAIDANPKSLLRDTIKPEEIRLIRSIDHRQNFLECVRSRSKPAADAETGHRSASVCHLGGIAILLGRKLKWNPANERFVDDAQANRMLSRPMRSPWRV